MSITLNRTGLRMVSPEVGDIVIAGRKSGKWPGDSGDGSYERCILKVLAKNAGSVFVEFLVADDPWKPGKRELLAIRDWTWTEASELYEAMTANRYEG